MNFGIVTIDPTFSLGEFDVTPITYRHLLLETRRGNSTPIFLGPILIHYKKSFASYLFFASSLIGLCPQLQAIRVFGTDGEQPLINAFSHEFGFSQHLTCFIHVRKNIKEKLSNCNIQSDVALKVLNDVFGYRMGTVFQEGLVDSTDVEDFQAKLESLIEKWNTLANSSSADMAEFIDWFKANKVEVIRDTMLRPVREECGLGNPPEIFTTNPSESMNAVLKRKLDFRKSELPVFVEKMKEVVGEQQKEVERAVIDRGKYCLRSEYRFLQVSQDKWFTMNAQQRAKHLSKVHSLVMTDVKIQPINDSLQQGDWIEDKKELSMDVNIASKQVNLPLTCIEGIWRKATELINNPNAMACAPGQSPESRMVLSYSGKNPHLITVTKGGAFNCDSQCPNWKSLGLCAHTIAVAEVNNKLSQFMSSLHKKKRSPNISSLITSQMPSGRGRKGNIGTRCRKTVEKPDTRMSMAIGYNHGDSSMSYAPVMVSVASPSPSFSPSHFSMNHPPPSFTPSHFSMKQPSPSFSPSYLSINQPPAYSATPSAHYFPWCPSPFSPSYSPFILCFIKGNISVCIGCQNKYNKIREPPDDLCIKHQEWRQFTPQGSDTPQQKYGNVYYHCKPDCVWLRCPYFDPQLLDITEVLDQLEITHKEYLQTVFNLQM